MSALASAGTQPDSVRDGEGVISLDDIDASPPLAAKTSINTRRRSTSDQTKLLVSPKEDCGAGPEDVQQPWKKYKPSTPEKSPKSPVNTEYTSPADPSRHLTLKTPATDKGSPCANGPELPPITTTRETTARGNLDEPLHLEAALARRTNWTPPAQKSQVIPDSDSPVIARDDQSDGEDLQPVTSFSNLISTYKCMKSTGTKSESPPTGDLGLKRKLPEIVPRAEPCEPIATVKPVVRPKAPRKKPRTITDLATAAYKQPSQPAPYTPADSNTAQLAKATPTDSSISTKAKTRKKPAKASKRKPPPPKPVLFSPETALKQVAKQDFVFGTSSQLAREQSPALLRDLQMAMKSSNQLDQLDFITPLNSDAIEPPEVRPRLWELAARDADGDLFDVEVSNMKEGLPQLPSVAVNSDPFGYCKGEERPNRRSCETTPIHSQRDDDSFLSLSDILPPSHTKSHTAAADQILPTVDNTQDSDPRPCVNFMQEGIEQPPPPNYDAYTDTQLSAEVAKFGFKPIKRRSAMIALLGQCWQQSCRNGEAPVRMASTLSNGAAKRPRGRPRKGSSEGSQVQEPPPSAQAPETPKRPRGRPRKIVAAEASPSAPRSKPSDGNGASVPVTARHPAVTNTIEIPDSESELERSLDSTPISSLRSTLSSPQAVDLTVSFGEDTELSLTMTPTDEQTTLFMAITKAITTAPRTDDPSHPSWHEKILLYDPIVLEDLAAWLNSGQLTRVKYDGEVNPVELKKWCESKSICCLWKVNLRGKERKRY